MEMPAWSGEGSLPGLVDSRLLAVSSHGAEQEFRPLHPLTRAPGLSRASGLVTSAEPDYRRGSGLQSGVGGHITSLSPFPPPFIEHLFPAWLEAEVPHIEEGQLLPPENTCAHRDGPSAHLHESARRGRSWGLTPIACAPSQHGKVRGVLWINKSDPRWVHRAQMGWAWSGRASGAELRAVGLLR